MPLYALASYPKSGNTWMRALLTNFLAGDGAPASINALINTGVHNRHRFDEWLGLSSSAMTIDEILLHRPFFQELIAANAKNSPAIVKLHEPYLRLPRDAPLFSSPTFAGAICIVRNPLDVAVSFAHHSQRSVDYTIGRMGDRQAFLAKGGRSLPSPISTWSHNVSSWLDQNELPLKPVSYEALHADPEAVLGSVVAFAGLTPNPERLARAVENSRFSRLREQERRHGFREKMPIAPNFFRKGRVGDWRGVLSRTQVRQLLDAHGPVMARLGYLEEAERFLQ